MTRVLRSGAKSGPSSPARTQRRRQPVATTSQSQLQQEDNVHDDDETPEESTPLDEPLSSLSVQRETSNASLAQCGACLDYFHWNVPHGNNYQAQEPGQTQTAKTIATIPAEHSEHQRLSTLDGAGFVFELCQRALCSGCFHSYLISRVHDAKTGIPLVPLSCAECRNKPDKPDCISSYQIKIVLSDTEWDEYQRQIILGTFRKKFFCPNPACSAVFDAEDAQLENHWDQPDTTQNRPLFVRDKEDEQVLELAKMLHWRKCPKIGCGHTIELSSGCNHITCICGKDFCYLCSADWAVEKDAQGVITQQYCSRKTKGGPKCPLYSEESLTGNVGQGFRQQRHSMEWIRHDRTSVPYQKANTFTRHLLASRKCGYCNAQCKTKRNLIAHLETSNHDVFDCCAKFYKTREDFNAHVAHSHPSRQWVSAEAALRVRRV